MESRLRTETGQSPIAPAKFYSFTGAVTNTIEQVQKARSHPWIAPDVPVREFVFDVTTGLSVKCFLMRSSSSQSLEARNSWTTTLYRSGSSTKGMWLEFSNISQRTSGMRSKKGSTVAGVASSKRPDNKRVGA